MNVTLITSNDKRITGLSRCEINLTSLIKKKIPVRIIPFQKLKKPIKIKKYFCLFQNLLGLNLKKNESSTELFHFMDQHLAMFLNFVPITKKIAVTVYDVFPLLPNYWKKYSLMDKIRYWLVFEGVKKADVLFTISEYTKKQIHEHLNFPLDKIHVFYDAADSNYKPLRSRKKIRQKYNIPDDKKVVLFVGSEQTRKNVQGLIKTFRLINEKLPETILVKIGEPLWQKERQENLSLIKELGLENKIIFIDYIPESELPGVYNLADLFMSLTLAEGGIALPIIEAMACGKPVLISDIPVLRETVEKAGIFAPLNNHEKAADEAVKILRNPKLALKLKQKSLKRAKFFDWETAASKIIEIYQKF